MTFAPSSSVAEPRGRFLPLVLISLALMAGALATSGCKPRFTPVTVVETHFFQSPVVLSMGAGSPEELQVAATLASSEIRRLERVFNPLNPDGGLYQLNETRSITDSELYPILERAYQVSQLTNGGLNIFMGYLERAYGFDKRFPRPPDRSAVRELLLPLRRASIQFVPDDYQMKMPNDAFAISLTGIEEAYTADQALAHLVFAGISNAMVQVGPHVACGGSPDGLGWPISVRDPVSGETAVRLFVENSGVAIASINDQAYTFRDSTYYNHLDPTTGRPARSLRSVTVVAPSCELAGGLARGIFVMNPEDGLRLLNDLPEIDGIILDSEGGITISDSLFIWIGK
ncbi:MAG: FAD:protein FMN transferase [Fidelibacterota bacterium]|nr:MAG: FAD:protein FMN transferase [Candidatus Neomarinimicrobiota bacterium]